MAEQLGIKFIETSAKNSDNVESAFTTLVRIIINHIRLKKSSPESTRTPQAKLKLPRSEDNP